MKSFDELEKEREENLRIRKEKLEKANEEYKKHKEEQDKKAFEDFCSELEEAVSKNRHQTYNGPLTDEQVKFLREKGFPVESTANGRYVVKTFK